MRTPSAPFTLLLSVLLAACSRQEAPEPSLVEPPTRATPAAPAREVFRLERGEAGGLQVSGVVATPEARGLLIAEVRRRWPGQPVGGDLTIDPDSPAMWVPEAMALLPFVASVEDGGLIVRAEARAAGGGVLTITGRVADDANLAALAADAEASVAPPFTVETGLEVGLVSDTAAVGEAESEPIVLAMGPGAEGAASEVSRALADASIAFRPGTAHLEAGAVDVLSRLATVMGGYPGITVEVLASGQGSGSSSLDRALASRRATAVVEVLRARGIAAGRLVASGEQSDDGTVTFRLSDAASE